MRADILVNWTGRDITTSPKLLTDARRHTYIERLADVIQHGLWMTIPPEVLKGNKGCSIKYEAPMTCFTEIRLSDAENHTGRYGLLGVGVSRHFVLERNGSPVHYVRNHCTECIVENLQAVLSALEVNHLEDARRKFSINAAFVKSMSDENTDNFLYLNEQEWRIVWMPSLVESGKLVKTGLDRPRFRIPLTVDNIQAIVFPDSRTRHMALNDSRFNDLLPNSSVNAPVLLTVEECAEF